MASLVSQPRSRQAWVALYLQSRRRKRLSSQGASPAAPVITSGWPEWDVTSLGWVDLVFDFTFVHGSFPVAQMEVWERHTGQSTHLVATIASTATNFRHAAVSQGSDTYFYKIRYKSGAVLGPFSNEYPIEFAPQ